MSRLFDLDYIPDPTKGRPLGNAKIYIGNQGTDPSLPENQIKLTGNIGLSCDCDIDLPQPVRTNFGGVTVYNNSPVWVNPPEQFYSIAVYDSKDNLVYNNPCITTSGLISSLSQQCVPLVSGQQTYTIPGGYQPGNITVFIDTDYQFTNAYTATDGSTITFIDPITFFPDKQPSVYVTSINVGAQTSQSSENAYFYRYISTAEEDIDRGDLETRVQLSAGDHILNYDFTDFTFGDAIVVIKSKSQGNLTMNITGGFFNVDGSDETQITVADGSRATIRAHMNGTNFDVEQ